MQSSSEHVCPRCYQLLSVAISIEQGLQRVLLSCTEPYCEYVLVLGDGEARPPATANRGVGPR